MDKTIVIYKSKYGATKQYAQWIGEALDCRVMDFDQMSKQELTNYDNIIYGGGVQAGGIKGFDKFKKWIRKYLWLVEKPEKNIIVFAVGINLQTSETRKQLRDINFNKKWLRGLTCYFLPGAYNPELVTGSDKMLMGMVKKMLNGKSEGERTPEDKVLIDAIENGCNFIDKEAVKPIIGEFKDL